MKTPDDWPRVKRVLEGALACGDGEREAYLAPACAGDASLRAQVDTLLAARDRAGDFLEIPAVLVLEETRRREDLSGRIVRSYRLTSRLGAGGMGDVYLARDTRLDRDVALKVLPEAFAADVEQLARFRREAQLLASLNHPNIGAIYGFEESGSIHALVLELVEGPTLADRIAQGPVPPDGTAAFRRRHAGGGPDADSRARARPEPAAVRHSRARAAPAPPLSRKGKHATPARYRRRTDRDRRRPAGCGWRRSGRTDGRCTG